MIQRLLHTVLLERRLQELLLATVLSEQSVQKPVAGREQQKEGLLGAAAKTPRLAFVA